MKKGWLLFVVATGLWLGPIAARKTPAADKKILHASQTSQEVQQQETLSFKPQIYGAVKAKFEISLYDGAHRFNVRNSRIGVKGLVSPYMRYAIQIDFNNEGKLSILDSYVSYFKGNFEFTLGQQQYKFSTDLDRGPSTNIFSNRSFLAKFLTTYYGDELVNGKIVPFVESIGSRDIGALARYRLPVDLPIRLNFGVFNGSGSNNPEWTDNLNFVGRLDVGGETGLSGAISHYNGRTPVDFRVVTMTDGTLTTQDFKQKLRMWGGELRYVAENYRIEAECAQRRLTNTSMHLLTVAHVQGYYQFRFPRHATVDYVAPIARWDLGDNIEFMNLQTAQLDRFSANRITVGVNVGFVRKLIGSELRFNYEKYFLDREPSDYASNTLLQDKITLGIVASF